MVDEPVDRSSQEYDVINKFLNATSEGRGLKLLEVWSVDRHGEVCVEMEISLFFQYEYD